MAAVAVIVEKRSGTGRRRQQTEGMTMPRPRVTPATTKPKTEAADALAAAARAYCEGPGWLAPFAHMIDVDPRTFRNWLAGKGEPAPEVLERAQALVRARLERHGALEAAARSLDACLK